MMVDITVRLITTLFVFYSHYVLFFPLSIPSLFRLNAVTGWCGQQEAFTYVSVDLGSIHRVKAILVKVGEKLSISHLMKL